MFDPFMQRLVDEVWERRGWRKCVYCGVKTKIRLDVGEERKSICEHCVGEIKWDDRTVNTKVFVCGGGNRKWVKSIDNNNYNGRGE
jgi:hypothetical protein